MILSAIAAMGSNRAIGIDNDLPWNLPKDMKFFVQKTKGHPIIMGRKNFDSIGKPLKNRTNIILSRNTAFK